MLADFYEVLTPTITWGRAELRSPNTRYFSRGGPLTLGERGSDFINGST